MRSYRVNWHRSGKLTHHQISVSSGSMIKTLGFPHLFYIFFNVHPRITMGFPMNFQDPELLRCWFHPHAATTGRSKRHCGGWQHCDADHHPSAAGKCHGKQAAAKWSGWLASARLCIYNYLIVYLWWYIYIYIRIYFFICVYCTICLYLHINVCRCILYTVYYILYTVYCILCIYIYIHVQICIM